MLLPLSLLRSNDTTSRHSHEYRCVLEYVCMYVNTVATVVTKHRSDGDDGDERLTTELLINLPGDNDKNNTAFLLFLLFLC